MGGLQTLSTIIQTLLIANRGEIAVRIARSAHAMGISTVAVFSDADRDALHTQVCDRAVHIGAAPPAESYLSIPAILKAAVRTGADAIHPGYGFLSENADFAQAVLEAGLIWVGPSPESIAIMGSKTAAREAVSRAGVPVVPGTHDVTQLDSVGFPLLIKAVAGGGGRGMRLVESAQEIEAALESARREAESAFGNASIFAERYIQNGRHIEIQVLGDAHGKVIHLHERECSIQRRHQKVIEEAPSPVLSAELREKMGAAAVRAAEAVNYVGAGTVEFLLAEEEFFFLEMNTRLQVEHPVTEAITGLDLVCHQLQIAQGASVPETPAIRGAAIEVRLYAEDPSENYAPQTGSILGLSMEDSEGIRLDTGIAEGSEVGIHYDPMMAKVISYGDTREEARKQLIRALQRLCLLGVRSNQTQLLSILRHNDFKEGHFHTGWLAHQEIPREKTPTKAAVAVLCHTLTQERSLLPSVAKGWRNSRFRPQRFSIGEHEIGWIPLSGAWRVLVDELEHTVRYQSGPSGSMLEIDGLRESVQVAETDSGYWVWFSEAAHFLAKVPRFPDRQATASTGDCHATTPGTVIQVAVQPDQSVEAGDPLLTLEAMKMEQTVCAPLSGVVSQIHVESGDSVPAGALLIEIEPLS